MSKSVKINGVTYESVPEIDIPLSTGEGSQSSTILRARAVPQVMSCRVKPSLASLAR